MIKLNKTDRKQMIVDLLRAITVAVVVHLLHACKDNTPMFNDELVYSVLFTTVGFAAYHIVTVNVIPHT